MNLGDLRRNKYVSSLHMVNLILKKICIAFLLANLYPKTHLQQYFGPVRFEFGILSLQSLNHSFKSFCAKAHYVHLQVIFQPTKKKKIELPLDDIFAFSNLKEVFHVESQEIELYIKLIALFNLMKQHQHTKGIFNS